MGPTSPFLTSDRLSLVQDEYRLLQLQPPSTFLPFIPHSLLTISLAFDGVVWTSYLPLRAPPSLKSQDPEQPPKSQYHSLLRETKFVDHSWHKNQL